MNLIPQRLAKLRALMEERAIDAYMVPTSDFHESEYVGSYFKCREFITGFTGSAEPQLSQKMRPPFGLTAAILSRPEPSLQKLR